MSSKTTDRQEQQGLSLERDSSAPNLRKQSSTLSSCVVNGPCNMLSTLAQSCCVLFTAIDQAKMFRSGQRASSLSSASSCSSPCASKKSASSSLASQPSSRVRKRPATLHLSHMPATAATEGDASEPPRKRSSCDLNLRYSRSQRSRNTGSANEEWGEVAAAKPKSVVDISAFGCLTGPRSGVKADSTAANLIGLSIHENQQASSLLGISTNGKSDHRKRSPRTVTFSSSITVIGGYAKTPADLQNSWSDSDIPRLLQNLALIFKVQGIVLSYPVDSVQELHRQRKTCMARMALVNIDNTLTQNRVRHMKMVLAEQQRQRQSNVVDIEELGKVSAKYSARNKEIANSSWWLERFNYGTSF